MLDGVENREVLEMWWEWKQDGDGNGAGLEIGWG
jgi:hypothetical protein